MVDRRYLEHPANIAIDDDRDGAMLKRWAEAAQAAGAQAWVQLSHPGRQCPKAVTRQPVAPSAVQLKGLESLFAMPRALTEGEIEDIINRFVTAAGIVQGAGFAGVQIHSAHGYLSSQFLSPLANLRTDGWGGALENRMRFLLSVIRGVRSRVGPAFPIGVKLNSADFQRGGFSEDESMAVVRILNGEGIDLLEISGGNYENPAMVGRPERTRQREAFFMDYAEKVRSITSIPLMLTGGFRSAPAMAGAVSGGAIDVVGLARPLAVEPDLPRHVLSGEALAAREVTVRVGVKLLDDMLQSFWYGDQLRRMGEGKAPDPRRSRYLSLARGLYTSLPF
jgi:2,4-dienoyl-CoA reductase-like NADH-dependent reductase (Old Yellow Enzyme family)